MRKPISTLRASVLDGRVLLTWYKGSGYLGDAHAGEFSRFRIYRRQESRFTFGTDYEEFFLGCRGTHAELIFEGKLPAFNARRYTFTDEAVSAGVTYSYFVQTVTSGRVGPIPVRVRDPQVWWPYEHMMSRLEALVDTAPDMVRLRSCGTTCAGRDIPCVEVGRGDRALALVGLVHAGESGPELIIPALEKLVDGSADLLETARVVAIPAVNIDAREQMVAGTPWYLRTTPQGVDLNRNFPARWEQTEYGYGLDSSHAGSGTYRGPFPASAPETRAIMSVFSGDRPDAVFSFHCLASICELPALAPAPGAGDTDYAKRCRRIVELYAKGLYPELPYSEHWLRFSGSAGSLPTWMYELGRIPAFDLEAGVRPETKPCVTDRTDRALLEEYQERHGRAIETLLREWFG